MKTILSVVVGSRLHNLHNEKSDYDIRGIFLNDSSELFDPFSKPRSTSWIEGDEDNTAYELKDFCKYAVQGNATILEILWSTEIRTLTRAALEMKQNRHKFLDSKRIYEAHKGYAHNQYNKMNLFEPDARTPKFAVAYVRSLLQGMELLATGDFTPQVTKYRDFLLDVKYNFRPELVPELSRLFSQLQVEFADVYAKNHDKFKPDLEWVRRFCETTYLENLL